MTTMGRRDLLVAGVALTGAFALPTWARPEEAPTAGRMRERLLMDFGWKFRLGHGSDPARDLNFGFGQSDFSKTGEFAFATVGYDDTDWRKLDLPHDWAVELPFVHDDSGQGDAQLRSHGYKPLGRRYPESSVGWYRREFDIPASDSGRRVWVEFDGAMRDSLVFVNGCFVGRHDDGYTPFRIDLSDYLNFGGRNAIVVRVDASAGDGWFYEGAGLYRHTWLFKTNRLSLARWESVVRSTVHGDSARLELTAQVSNLGVARESARVSWKIFSPDGQLLALTEAPSMWVDTDRHACFDAALHLRQPQLWSIDLPYLYAAEVTLHAGGVVRDVERIEFGIRTVEFDASKGFILNGRQTKIQGVCNHQDHAGVGTALPDALHAFRIGVLREMGCNALRTAHNMPTPELVEACDRMGMMVLCENRELSSSAEGQSRLEAMVRCLRNSPSVILWSIGNEETLLQKPMAVQGARIAASLVRRCHELDPGRAVTVAVNSDNEQGVSDAVDVIGFNYVQWMIDDFHRRHPLRPVLSTETSSATSTRGEYVTDPARHTMNSYDGKVSWGETPETWWKFHAEREWLAGGFAWTGFDYRGEPTPYGWPSVSSQFGVVDTCGFPKDYYYYYRAWWRSEPALHLFPHWNWAGQEGRDISVWVYSNLDEVELLVNGRSVGRKVVPRLGHLAWSVPYVAGSIEARAFRAGRLLKVERRETAGDPVAVRLVPDRQAIDGDGEDVAVVRVEAVDAAGRFVPTADTRVRLSVSGAGRLAGVGNGDPNSHESDQASSRACFNGLAQIIVRASRHAGDILVEATPQSKSADLQPTLLRIQVRPADGRPVVEPVAGPGGP